MIRLIVLTVLATFAGSAWAQITATPAPHSFDAARNASVTATFAATPAAPTAADFVVTSRLRGRLAGTVSLSGNTWVFDPAADFLAGEEIEACLPGYKFCWRFSATVAAKAPVYGTYTRPVTATAYQASWGMRCGDLDKDGDIDAVIARWGEQSHVYLNDGSGAFSVERALSPWTFDYIDCVLADFDSDGDLDIAMCDAVSVDMLYLNDGAANFTQTRVISTSSLPGMAMAAGDIDSDGDIDLVPANGGIRSEDLVYYVNDGTGNFTTRQIPYVAGTTNVAKENAWDVALGDMDNDGDLDIVYAVGTFYGSEQSGVYVNDGQGNFSMFTATFAMNVVRFGNPDQNTSLDLGDFDSDGDLDIALGTNFGSVSYPRPACLWVNDQGSFSLFGSTGQFTGWYDGTHGTKFANFDGDNQLDLTYCNDGALSSLTEPAKLLINGSSGPGTTYFILGTASDVNRAVDVADLDNDGDLEVVMPDLIYYNGSTPCTISVRANSIWLADGATVNVAYNSTLAALGMEINVADPDSTIVQLATSISNVTTQGFVPQQFNTIGVPPVVRTPTTGVFNVGGITHTFVITADDAYGVYTFTFKIAVGAAPQPDLALFDGAIAISHGAAATGGRDFGSRDISAGPSASLAITIRNLGTAALTVSGVTLAGANSGEFVLNTNGMLNMLAPMASTTFTLAFDPTTAGMKTATVEVAHSDASKPTPFTFGIAGVATTVTYAPILVVRCGSTMVAPGATRVFGSVAVGSASQPQIIRIENAGNSNLNLGTPYTTGAGASQFVLDTTGFATTVAPGAITTFSITFAPSAAGSFTANIEFVHDDASQATPFSFAASGTGTPVTPPPHPPAPAPTPTASGGGGCAASSGMNWWVLLLLAPLWLLRRKARRA